MVETYKLCAVAHRAETDWRVGRSEEETCVFSSFFLVRVSGNRLRVTVDF